MKGAIDYADSVSTVSNSYAGEIMDSEYAHGLEGVLIKNSCKLKGILNGIDIKVYDPSTNASLFANFDKTTVDTLKKENKMGLQKMLNLPVNGDVPMIAMITRLVNHKGLDIVRSAFNDVLKNDVQFVVLGTGDPDHENFFRHMQNVYGDKVRSIIAFNKDMAQKIYASADIFLMPSKSEPCGLSQMMALRYGTIPVVRACGGLKDSIFDCGNGDEGNGFVFVDYNNVEELSEVLNRKIKESVNKQLISKDAITRYDSQIMANNYIEIYKNMLN
jgi:starch synthase